MRRGAGPDLARAGAAQRTLDLLEQVRRLGPQLPRAREARRRSLQPSQLDLRPGEAEVGVTVLGLQLEQLREGDTRGLELAERELRVAEP